MANKFATATSEARLHLVVYQPDMPENLGAMMRIAACFGVPIDLIEPAAFPIDERRVRRVSMDYACHLEMVRHESFEAFDSVRRKSGSRLIVMSAHSDVYLHRFVFQSADNILVGRETAGVPNSVLERADDVLRIPLAPGLRSLNVHVAAAVALSEALRQTGQFDEFTGS